MPTPKVRVRCGMREGRRRRCSRILAEVYAPSDYAAAIAEAKSAGETSEVIARVRRVAAPPEDWSGKLRIQPCPKHDKPRRQFTEEVLARSAAGYDDLRPSWVFHDVSWTKLAPAYRLADTTGKVTEETVYD